MPYSLQIGSKLIADITNPKPHEIDLPAVDRRLRRIVRFSDHPGALTVAQHQSLVKALVERVARSKEDVIWARHHDDVEAITGDLVGPIKNLLCVGRQSEYTFIDLEDGFAEAILWARGYDLTVYDKRFRDNVMPFVHAYDKLAETMEWLFIMGMPAAPWNVQIGPEDMKVFAEWREKLGDPFALSSLREVLP